MMSNVAVLEETNIEVLVDGEERALGELLVQVESKLKEIDAKTTQLDKGRQDVDDILCLTLLVFVRKSMPQGEHRTKKLRCLYTTLPPVSYSKTAADNSVDRYGNTLGKSTECEARSGVNTGACW